MNIARALGWIVLGIGSAAMIAACGSKGEGGDGGSAPEGPSCAEYCDMVMMNCMGDQKVYVSNDVCLKVCASMAPGKKGDTTGNTLGCRTYHAGAAAMDATTHCPHAGPGGAGYCGTNCEGYCTLVRAACPEVYKSADECAMACQAFPDMEPYSVNDTSGNTVQCRLYHSTVATTDPKTHCGHVGIMPATGTCTDP